MFENLFFFSICLLLPLILIIHKFSFNFAAIVATFTIFFHGLVPLPELDNIFLNTYDSIQTGTNVILANNDPNQSYMPNYPGSNRNEPKLLKKVLLILFDLDLHRRLEDTFPDWKERMDYQEEQEKFYHLALEKQKTLKGLRLKDDQKYYSKDELEAISYFHGTGFYKKQQDPRVKPNKFDTRQSFLLKMHDEQMRDEFLASFNRKTS